MAQRRYPAEPAGAALQLFAAWVGSHYARSVSVGPLDLGADGAGAKLRIGRRWDLEVTVLDTFAAEATVMFEAERAAIEKRLDTEELRVALWAPRAAPLPADGRALDALMQALREARPLEDGRLEVRRPVRLYLRRNSQTGSVITILGGLSPHWAQFTGRVAGSFQLNSVELLRLPASQAEREALAERIVLAAGQPEVDEGVSLPAEDAWTANSLEEGRACLLGSPVPESDEANAALRRNLRRLLRETGASQAGHPRALVVAGSATYAEEEKLSWVLRGMDPALYAGFELVATVADGVVRPLIQPARQTLPWDAPLARG